MGVMGLFSGKKEVTTAVKNELNKNIEHWKTLVERINRTDSISTYFKSFEDLLYTYKKLQMLEDTYDWKHGKYKWSGGAKEALQGIQDKRAVTEIAFVDRVYEKLQRDCLKLTTYTAKEKKRAQFFVELEHYYKYLEDSTIEYIKSL